MSSEILTDLIKENIDNIFQEVRKSRTDGKNRSGIHTSSVIATKGSFCYRKEVLEFLFENNKYKWLPTKVVRRMSNGNYTHEKWQDLFKEANKAYFSESRFISKRWNFSGSPDIIVNLRNKKWVVEIKSTNEDNFDRMTKLPIGTERQIQMYMYLSGIPRGIVIYENTNTSDYRPYLVDIDYEMIAKYLDRLHKIDVFIDVYNEEDALPKRKEKCWKEDAKPVERCPMGKVCFGSELYREKMRKNEGWFE